MTTVRRDGTDGLTHRIADLSYREDRLVCTCSAVMTARHATAWADHRRSLGLPAKSISQVIGNRRR